MLRITKLFWSVESVDHLWDAHRVTPDEVEEVLFGIDGEEPSYRILRDGDFYVVYGETGGGRLLTMVLEPQPDGAFRPFAARGMTQSEKRAYRRG